jgi:type II secretory pathway pseudopilin PulG
MRNAIRALRSDRGLTLVELGVGMLIGAMLSALMVVWLGAGVRSELTHQSYDEALSDLRDITDQMSREIRTSNALTALGDQSLSLWLDGDRDDEVDTGEIVTWAIDGSDVLRSVDGTAGAVILGSSVSSEASVFAYDAATAAEVGRVTITLVTLAETRDGRDQIVQTVDIYLRNS